jgi:hypothetical protein
MALSPSVWLLGLLAALRSIPAACSNTVLYAHAVRALPAEDRTAVFALSPLPRNASQLVFPLFAALVAGLAPGAALALGAVSFGATFLAGLHLAAVTRATPVPTADPRKSGAEEADSTPS